MSQTIIEKVSEIVLPIVKEREFELADVVFEKLGKDYFLRVLIDKPGGITVNDTAEVSEVLAPLLDTIQPDPFPDHYMLEVASPGVEKPIKDEEDWSKAHGKYIHVNLYQAVDGVKQYEGDLISSTSDTIVLSYREKTRIKEIEIKKQLISKARLAIKF
ncbi:MAG: ribosome maturation factor RimP [Streptococcaceae bacterium]|jgi:ribosome maturation factor RimP|nr:ribosome maturation factor RimP [Streptococcaceae bacterium]